MPNFDKTGPIGKGPMTGRKKGKCTPREKNKMIETIIKKRKK